ncbi:MAG: hypothetical protein MZW92_28275 [Comamonadaceae bacterium]|nr:hypothetical protein [Comamonadaceae bacterium]
MPDAHAARAVRAAEVGPDLGQLRRRRASSSCAAPRPRTRLAGLHEPRQPRRRCSEAPVTRDHRHGPGVPRPAARAVPAHRRAQPGSPATTALIAETALRNSVAAGRLPDPRGARAGAGLRPDERLRRREAGRRVLGRHRGAAPTSSARWARGDPAKLLRAQPAPGLRRGLPAGSEPRRGAPEGDPRLATARGGFTLRGLSPDAWAPEGDLRLARARGRFHASRAEPGRGAPEGDPRLAKARRAISRMRAEPGRGALRADRAWCPAGAQRRPWRRGYDRRARRADAQCRSSSSRTSAKAAWEEHAGDQPRRLPGRAPAMR